MASFGPRPKKSAKFPPMKGKMTGNKGRDPAEWNAEAERTRLRTQIEYEMHAEIRDEIRVEEKEKAEKNLRQKIEDETRMRLLVEQQSLQPSAAQRAQAREHLASLEVDSLACARVASIEAKKLQSAFDTVQKRTLVGFLTALIGFSPMLFTLHLLQLGWGNFAWWAVVIPWVLSGLVCLIVGVAEDGKGVGEAKAMSTKYSQLAQRLKAASLDVSLMPNALNMAELVKTYVSDKSTLDGKYRPSDQEVQRVRVEVKDELIGQMDVDVLTRIDADSRFDLLEDSDGQALQQRKERSSHE